MSSRFMWCRACRLLPAVWIAFTCALRLMGQELSDIPRSALSPASSFVLASGGEAFFYNYDAGIAGRPFLADVYKPLGFSSDAQYFLYLRSEKRFPTFELTLY